MSELTPHVVDHRPPTSSQAVGGVALEQTASSHSNWEMRAREIEHIVDPGHTLPKIELRADTDFEREHGAQGYTRKLAYDATGTKVGLISTRSSQHTDSGMTEISYVHTNRPGRGYGMAMYLAVIMESVSQGKILTNDPSGLSPRAKSVWEKLHTLGVAVEREPFVPSDLSPSDYRGRYEVLP